MRYFLITLFLLPLSAAGAAWQPVGAAAGNVTSLAADPDVAGLLLASVDGDIRRLDRGTWSTVFHDDHQPSGAIAFDPAIPARALAAVAARDFEGFHLFDTRDTGVTWARSTDVAGINTRPELTRIVFDPDRPSALYFLDGTEVVKASDDYGATWHDLVPGGPSIRAFAVTPRSLYAGSTYGIYRSDDRGATWTRAAAVPIEPTCYPDPSEQRIEAIAVSGDTLLIVNFSCDGSRVFTSGDGGRSWRGPFRFPQFVSSASQVIADAAQPGRFFVATSLGVYRSDDGGESWLAIEGTGPVQAIALDLLGHRLYAGTPDTGVWALDLTPPTPRRRAVK